MPSLNHIHTYKRHRKMKGTFICTDPHCSHKSDKYSILGKVAKCFSCGKVYILTSAALRLAFPHCGACTKGFQDSDAHFDDNDQFLDIVNSLDIENKEGEGI